MFPYNSNDDEPQKGEKRATASGRTDLENKRLWDALSRARVRLLSVTRVR